MCLHQQEKEDEIPEIYCHP